MGWADNGWMCYTDNNTAGTDWGNNTNDAAYLDWSKYGTVTISGCVIYGDPLNQKYEEDKMQLFEVVIVDNESYSVIFNDLVVAKNSGLAEKKALLLLIQKQDVDELSFFTKRLGELPEKREPKEVRVVD